MLAAKLFNFQNENVGQQQLFIIINVLRQLGYYNRVASDVRQEGWPGLINKELYKGRMMFQIKSVESDALLEFFDLAGDYFKVSLRSSSHSAVREVYAYTDPEGIAELLQEAAREWRGWSGIKSWESLEGEFKIELKADKTGHITIDVDINHDCGNPEPWRLRSGIMIEAGQLETIAKRSIQFFRPR